MPKRYHGARIRLLLLSAILCGPQRFASAEDAERLDLPRSIERVLAWLPEDTETVVAAQSFKMPDTWDEREDSQNTFPSGLNLQEAVRARSALEGLVELDRGKYLSPLAGKAVALTLRGGRNFESVSAFGHYRSEGCAVIVFEQDLGEAAKQWTGMLREGGKNVRRIAGREVFVFPATPSMNPAHRPRPWLGVYLVLLKPDTVLCATSDKYLEELLKRVDAPAPRRALPNDLPEWKHVNLEAPAWMLRHISRKNEDRSSNVGRGILGVTWTMTDARFRVVFLSEAKDIAKEVEQQARKRWNQETLGVHADVALHDGGTVTISSATAELGGGETFWFQLALDNLAGIEDYRDGK